MTSILKKNIIHFVISLVLLSAYCYVKYLVIPEYEDYEFFSYSLMGGITLYAIYYIIITIVRLFIKNGNNSLVSIILSFFLLELILYLLSGSSLLLSIFSKGNVLISLIYHIIPFMIIGSMYLIKNKK